MKSEERSLSADELALITYLVKTFPDASPFAAQIGDLRVVGGCGCGCPSIDFVENRPGLKAYPIADFVGRTDSDVAVGGMLWVADGSLASLEVYTFGSVDDAFGLPRIDSIQPFHKNSATD